MQLAGTIGEALTIGRLPDTSQQANRWVGKLAGDLIGCWRRAGAMFDVRMHGQSCDQQTRRCGEERFVAWHPRVLGIGHIAQQPSAAA
ncbi:hypothetical protein [Xanthomonas cucurbitae]|uniref:hypothetical protein n=1 Tax=Xanthomonas cucurbitae TaxID=56453 RepID=UPI001CB79130|nr:hypothetical protein [Xanthomonas cucurbitae]